MTSSATKNASRDQISRVVRELRKERGWTQDELGRQLGLSQNRLSEIERGGGSFTAEQFLQILKLFNVPATRFIGEPNYSQQLQNALARLGASHLVESDSVVPADGLADVSTAIEQTLLLGEPRLTLALAPVLVANVDRVALHKLYLDLDKIGFERRLAWLCENTLSALDQSLLKDLPRTTVQRARRAVVVLEAFLNSVRHRLDRQPGDTPPPDVFDTGVRSQTTLASIQAEAYDVSRRWGIVSTLQPQDFAEAIRAASASNS